MSELTMSKLSERTNPWLEVDSTGVDSTGVDPMLMDLVDKDLKFQATRVPDADELFASIGEFAELEKFKTPTVRQLGLSGRIEFDFSGKKIRILESDFLKVTTPAQKIELIKNLRELVGMGSGSSMLTR